MTLVARIASTIAGLRLTPKRAIVAVSGGVDSVVLLELLARSRVEHGLDLVVAHIDHGIQPGEEPRRLVARQAERLGLPLIVHELDLGGDTTETEAREARHAALRTMAAEQGAAGIFLAHHADDQAETILMRLLRGSGGAGLSGMTGKRGRLLRPLLGVPRRMLIDFARAEGLAWWEDPANRDPRHLRSWLRRDILPAIDARLPDVADRLADVARHATRERLNWRAVLAHWPGLDWNRADGVDSVRWDTLAAVDPAVREGLLRTMMREAGCRAGIAPMERGWAQLRSGDSGRSSDLGGGWIFELAFGRFRLLRPDASPTAALLASPTGTLDWGRWHLRWRSETAPAMQERMASTAWFSPGSLAVRPWRPGDRLMPLGGTGRRLAVRCFQDARIARSDRAGWPIIEAKGTIAWIPGVCRSDQLLPPAGVSSLRVEVSPRV